MKDYRNPTYEGPMGIFTDYEGGDDIKGEKMSKQNKIIARLVEIAFDTVDNERTSRAAARDGWIARRSFLRRVNGAACY